MKLQIGKRYIRRNGTVSLPLVSDGYWLKDPDSGIQYDKARVFAVAENDYDLVSPVDDEDMSPVAGRDYLC